MATLESVFDRDLLLRTVDTNPERLTPLWASGAFSSNNDVAKLVAAGTDTFTVPFIMDLDADLESNYSNTIYTDIAMPRTIEAGKMSGQMAYLNEHFLEAHLSKALSGGEEALNLIAKQIDGLWARQAELRAVATVIGLRNNDQAGDKALAVDISVASAATDANRFNADAVIDLESTFKQSLRNTGAVVMHPKVVARIEKQDAAAIERAPSELGTLKYYRGRVIVESTEGTFIGGAAAAQRYVTYFLGNDSFTAESVRNKRDMKLSTTELTGNGGGHEILSTRRDMLIHPQGYSFLGTTLTGGTKNEALFASWSDLTLATNWQRVVNANNIPVRYLITNV